MATRILAFFLTLLAIVVVAIITMPTAESAGEPAYVYWGGAPILNQGGTSQCVGYALETFLQDGPNAYTANNIPSPYWIYTGAQARDEWRDTKHDGTSDQAGFQYLKDFGYVDSVTYTSDPQVIADYVMHNGPVAMSTEWTYSMNAYDPATFEITVEGQPVGFHEYVIDGFDRINQVFDAQNSWGPYFGNFGHFKVDMTAMRALLQNNDAPENREAALVHKSVTKWLSVQVQGGFPH